MHLAVFVVGQWVLLQTLRDCSVVDDDGPFWGGGCDEVQNVEQFSRVAAAVAQQGVCFFELHFAFFEHRVVADGMVEQFQQIVFLQALQHIDLAA